MCRTVHRFTLSLAIALPVSSLDAATIVVDVHDGPGTDFTKIQPAIDAAQPGDVICVRGGDYSSFTLTKGVAILGDTELFGPVVSFAPGVVIAAIPAGETVALHNLFMNNLELKGCKGLVVADRLNLAMSSAILGTGDTFVMSIAQCADVRMRQFGINPGNGSGRDGVVVQQSRFEVDGASIDGAKGALGNPGGPDGGDGLVCGPGSDVRVSFSQVRGGQAGPGAAGGAGIVVTPGATLRVNGTEENKLFGGWADCSGSPGPAVFVDAAADARLSVRVGVFGGTAACGPDGAAFDGPGVAVIADPPDLSMVFSGGVAAVGVSSQVIVVGVPGEQVILLAGVDAVQVPAPAFLGNPLLVDPVVVLPLGPMSPSGDIIFDATVPAILPPGLVLHTQAASLRAGGQQFLSNSASIVVGL